MRSNVHPDFGRIRKAAVFGLVGTMILSCSGCGLIPKEEELPTAPYLAEAETESYTFTPVFVGDIQVTESVRSNYVPSANEKLAFDIGGEYIENIYVELGDAVKAGDVLMELDVSAISAQITAQEEELSQLYRQVGNLETNRDLDLEEAELQDQQAAAAGNTNWVSRTESIREGYEKQISSVYSSIYVSEIRLKELIKEKEERQLIAGIDGVVTSIAWMGDRYRTEKGETLIQISDMNGALFEVFTSNGDLLESGKHYELECNGEMYEVIAYTGVDLLGISPESGEELSTDDEEGVLAESDTGLQPETALASVDPEGWYLEMVTPDPSISRNDTGIVRIVLEESNDTLYVQSSAVKEVNGVYIVYYMSEEGFRTSKEVTIGLSNGKVTEILSGVEEGEYLIVP